MAPYIQRVQEHAHHEHPTMFPCVRPVSPGSILPTVLDQNRIHMPLSMSCQQILTQEWLGTALVETMNFMPDDPPPGWASDPFQAAETQLHGELALLLYFIISYGHDLLDNVGQDKFCVMMNILMDMKKVMSIMEELVHLQGRTWFEVVMDMEPCMHSDDSE